MAERMEIEYAVQVTGLDGVTAAANSARQQADQASAALENTRSSGSKTLPIIFSSVRALTNARQAVEQTQKAIRDLNPLMALSAFVNMAQTVQSLSSLMKTLKASTAAASAAQAILVTLAGAWWLIPLAIAAGALIYSRIQSMQAGGIVKETKPYLLHRGEYVIPEKYMEKTERIIERNTTPVISGRIIERVQAPLNRFGPFYITFEKQPEEDDRESWIRSLETTIVDKIRRGA